ncbi:MAG: M36 family metallopeptidase [Anaerolineae bacterium]|nr:M36 family metallopeptidase [Anaerolineae bacterium]
MTSTKRIGLLLASVLVVVLAMNGVVWARENDDAVQALSSQVSPLALALTYLEENKTALGLTDADLDGLIVQWQYTSQHNGVTHIFLRQTHAGIEVWNGNIQINIARDGRIINLHNQFVSDLAGNVNEITPRLTAIEAVTAAAGHLRLTITEPLEIQELPGGTEQAVIVSTGGISYRPIPVKLMYQPGEKGQVRLAWDMEIEELGSIHWWTMRVDGETGVVLSQHDRVAEDSYRVYPIPVESPYFSVPPAPADGRTLVLNPATANGSPFGWHDTNGIIGADFTTTQGNNAHAYTDTDANNIPDIGSSPDGGPTLVFDFPIDLTQQPNNYQPAAVSNLFYWSNVIHDVFYEYGFTESAGNFQENNYGNGGLASDYVQAEAQDGSGTCNANFGTPGDGGNPRMQMYICENGGGAPAHDGDLDNLVITHEYGHGISNRLADPASASCLFNAEQMGEGWSDFWGIWMTMEPGDTGLDPRAVGTYLFEQGPGGAGIRPARYSTNFAVNNFTYGDLPGLAIPHGVGFLWATMLWDMNWALIDEYGYNPNIYDAWNTGGNNLANQLVIDGLTLQPCGPGFVDGRDAILAADVALTGGVNQCTIWQAFANRGLGFSASQGSSSSTSDGAEAFDLPPACLTLNIPVPSIDICQGDTAVYNIGIGVAYTPPVSMSATGNPAPSTAVFTPNPVPTAPGTTDLAIGNTGAVAAGSYTINVVADDGSVTDNSDVDLNVFAATPGAPTLLSPATGTTGVSTLPILSWNAIADAISYEVEIATDVGFQTSSIPLRNQPQITPLALPSIPPPFTFGGCGHKIPAALVPLPSPSASLPAICPCCWWTTMIMPPTCRQPTPAP